MSLLYPDKVEIASVTVDETYGSEIKGAFTEYEAFVEQEDKLSFGTMGITINPRMKIYVPRTVTVKKGYYIKVTELHGATLTTEDALGKERKITKAEPLGGSSVSHIEIEVESFS